MASREYIYEKFRSFYLNPSSRIPSPSHFIQREFAFLLFRERVMARHKGFANHKAYLTALGERVPSDVYYSSAYYENPEAEMERKGWLGADLVFDIDADHIPTSCNKIHDEWTCGNPQCGFSGRGITPENCPICNGTKFETKTWPCDLCLESAKHETVKLIDMLEKDFGFAEEDLRVYFSGHRGYHVHVETEMVRTLDAGARKEIVDYVLGTGMVLFEDQGKDERSRSRARKAFGLTDFGWHRRLKDGIKQFIADATKETLREIEIRNYGAILKNKEVILKRCVEEGRWDSIQGIKREKWRKIVDNQVSQLSSKIDTVVTTDVHRLIRADGTLHGKTGLRKVEFLVKDLDTFDPFNRAVAFKEGEVEVFVFDAPEFHLSGCTFGPYKNQKVELPTAAAVLLICKGRAEVAG